MKDYKGKPKLKDWEEPAINCNELNKIKGLGELGKEQPLLVIVMTGSTGTSNMRRLFE